jgi:hypothetical protein
MTVTAAKQMTAGNESEMNAFLKFQPVSNNKPPRTPVLAEPTYGVHAVSLLAGRGRGLTVSIYKVRQAPGNRYTLLPPGDKTSRAAAH